MRLYFGGCSGVAGQDLSNPQRDAFPAIVADRLQADFLNDARSGSSNDRIFSRALRHIDQFDHFFISWTSIDRRTLTMPGNLAEAELTLAFQEHDRLKKYAPFRDYGTLYYGHWYSPLREFQNFLSQIISLGSIFECKGKKYTMIMSSRNSWPMWTTDEDSFIKQAKHTGLKLDRDQLMLEYQHTHRLLSMIDRDKFVGFGEFFLTEQTKNYPVGPTKHPLEECHSMYADRVLEHYRKYHT